MTGIASVGPAPGVAGWKRWQSVRLVATAGLALLAALLGALLGSCTPVQGEGRAADGPIPIPAAPGAPHPAAAQGGQPLHHRPDGFVNSDGSRVNKPLSELLTWWWQRRAIDLDALVDPQRIEAAWASMPEEWRTPQGGGEGPAPGDGSAAGALPTVGGATAVEVSWLGHASVLLAFRGSGAPAEPGAPSTPSAAVGFQVLCDPHFSERASPVAWAGPRRLHPVPDAVGRMGRIDVVLISHNHYDHLDATTVRNLARQEGGSPRFLVPLGLDRWFREQGITNVQALDWWDSVELGGARFHFVPAHHWSGRGVLDRNRTLWGGWVVLHPALRFYFAGDTGWSQDFEAIARRFAPFDLAALPVGAYEPRWFMAAQHTNPLEAVRIHKAIGSPLSLGIHWGTFQLTDEPYEAPIEDLKAALRAEGIPLQRFRLFLPGQSMRLPTTGALAGPAN